MIIIPNNMWTNYLQLGSLLLFCGLFVGCDTSRTEWVHRGEWVYRNESAHEIQITGVIVSFTMGDVGTVTVSPGESQTVEFRADGDRDVSPEAIGFPLDFRADTECNITIDRATSIPLEPNTGIRDRNEYLVEKLGAAYYRFTYTVTDEMIDRMIETSGMKP